MVQLPGLDSVEQMCWHEFLDSSIRLLAAIDSRLNAKHGLSLTEIRLLNLLATSHTGAARKTELCHVLMVPPARLTQMFRHLRPRGLLAQSATAHDRRGILLSITDLGRAGLEAARKTLADEVRTLYLGRLSYQQMIAMTDVHRRINTAPRTSATWLKASDSDLTACD